MVNQLQANQSMLNWVIGGIFTLTAIIQLWKILSHKDAAEKLETIDAEAIPPIEDHHEHKEEDRS